MRNDSSGTRSQRDRRRGPVLTTVCTSTSPETGCMALPTRYTYLSDNYSVLHDLATGAASPMRIVKVLALMRFRCFYFDIERGGRLPDTAPTTT